MEEKKNPVVNLENKKGAYFAVGLLFTLAIVLALFEFKTFPVEIQDLGKLELNLMEEEVIPVSLQAPPPPPPPPAPTTQIEIVEDDVEIEDELEIEDMEVDEDTEINVVIEEEPEEEIYEEEIFTIVENMPEFPGGTEALFKHLAKNIKYPAMAKDAGIKGKVYVTFVVDKDGSIADVKVLRGIGGGCDEEAVRVIKESPLWKPGMEKGVSVNVRMIMPITFKLG